MEPQNTEVTYTAPSNAEHQVPKDAHDIIRRSTADQIPVTEDNDLSPNTWADGDMLDQCLPLEDLNFGSLDSYLTDLMTDWAQGTTVTQQIGESTLYVDSVTTRPSTSRGSPTQHQEGGILEDQCMIDEQCSNDISKQLRPTVQNFDTVLSADYLNLCLQLYFTHFHPVFPVVHVPTFRPRTYNTLLLTSTCSIGSLTSEMGNHSSCTTWFWPELQLFGYPSEA